MTQQLDPQIIDEYGLEQAELAFALSRRHGLPFGVLALRIDLHSRPSGGLALLPDVAERLRIEDALRNGLRRTDLMAHSQDAGHYVVFCPSTPAEGVKELSERIRRLGGTSEVRIGTASFREDGLTLHDLIDMALARAEPTALDDDAGTTPDSRQRLRTTRRDSLAGQRLWPLQVRKVRARRRLLNQRIKRAFDLVFVAATVPAWAPIAALVALSLKVTEPAAPVLFVQQRTGLGGRRFGMVKFRTMVPNAEAIKQDLRHLNQRQWPDFKIEKDPRITELGRILRKTSLDELPQLWNVLRGDMSLVGPRPTSFASDTYDAWHTARLEVLPGMTGLWQVEKRGTSEFDERLRLDLEYVERQGFFFDIWILIRTIKTVFEMRGGQ